MFPAWQATLCALASCFALCSPSQAAPIPDEPLKAFEPGLETDDHLLGELAWIDRQTLLVTALSGPDSPFYERKVVLVDVDRATRQDVAAGALVCANPQEGIAGLLVGTEEALYTGKSKAPKPTLKLFGWQASSGQLSPKDAAGVWSAWICRKTSADDINMPGLGFLQKEIRYLQAGDGHLMLSLGPTGRESTVTLVKANRSVVRLQASAYEISAVPEYLPFRRAYLLTTGRFVMNGTIVQLDGTATTELPLVTMTPDGQVQREAARHLFAGRALVQDGETLPTANGLAILVGTRPRDGGGIYLSRAGELRRVWCVNGGGVYDRQCRVLAAAVSPDGCHLAFYAVGSDHAAAVSTNRPTLKILPLCKP